MSAEMELDQRQEATEEEAGAGRAKYGQTT